MNGKRSFIGEHEHPTLQNENKCVIPDVPKILNHQIIFFEQMNQGIYD